MTSRRWQQTDNLYRAVFGRLLRSVLAHGRSGSEERDRWLKDTAGLVTDSTVTISARAAHLDLPPGRMLAQRYRIVNLLGRGAMGEVYRADDLLLGQPVALKFLASSSNATASSLSRFRNEVRTARQVSHPNVCRVYDIGEAEGLTYLSMEYVDGEDLASLLRRIGRLPRDKALEIARKLCAGLAAAHDKGVIHRDLKPANIMLDGKGHIRITDFSIAGLAEEIHDVRSGTPAYMSPEQLAGKEVTTYSDIYALGIVIHELLTGKRPSLEHLEQVNPELDPGVGRVIRRCLDSDPRMRPTTPLSVAAALPGGDPLAEALAAGDTPSPDVVAASQKTGAISIRTAGLCLALVLMGLVGVVILSSRTNILRMTPFPEPPEVLSRRAHDLAVRLGYANQPTDSAFGLVYDTDYREYAERSLKPDDYREQVARGRPPLIFFWYRQSPQSLETLFANGDVSQADPPPILPGMLEIDLDPQGHLIFLRAVPHQLDAAGSSARPVEWNVLFESAGLDPTRFTLAYSQEIPGMSFDTRATWIGSYADAPFLPLRIEAASWQGRPVSFQLIRPWTRPRQAQPVQWTAVRDEAEIRGTQRAQRWLRIGVAVPILIAAPLLAWRNYRRGRGDVRGSYRLGVLLPRTEARSRSCKGNAPRPGPGNSETRREKERYSTAQVGMTRKPHGSCTERMKASCIPILRAWISTLGWWPGRNGILGRRWKCSSSFKRLAHRVAGNERRT